MSALSRRVRSVERKIASHPPPPQSLCPDAWTARFAAYRPEHAQLLDELREGLRDKASHAGNALMCKVRETGCADTGRFPDTPTEAEQRAIDMVRRFHAMTKGYQAESGDRWPIPIWGL